jgi:hypothetical protein
MKMPDERCVLLCSSQCLPASPASPAPHPEKDACVALAVRDPALLAPALRKTAAVLAAVPALEAFVLAVCGACYREGLPFVPAALVKTPGALTPGAVPAVLSGWLRALRRGERMRALLVRLRGALAGREGGAAAPTAAAAEGSEDEVPGEAEAEAVLTSGKALVEAAEQLVGCRGGGGGQFGISVLGAGAGGRAAAAQLLFHCVSHDCARNQMAPKAARIPNATSKVAAERASLDAAEVFAAARGLMAAQPEGLLQRLVAHAQRLLVRGSGLAPDGANARAIDPNEPMT